MRLQLGFHSHPTSQCFALSGFQLRFTSNSTRVDVRRALPGADEPLLIRSGGNALIAIRVRDAVNLRSSHWTPEADVPADLKIARDEKRNAPTELNMNEPMWSSRGRTGCLEMREIRQWPQEVPRACEYESTRKITLKASGTRRPVPPHWLRDGRLPSG
jgi:hypothetical protein